MIIVSQDKCTIVNFNNVENIDIVASLDGTGKVPYAIYYETNSKREELGEYATEERAKEVLDDITNTRAIFEMYKCVDTVSQDVFDEKMMEENLIFDTYQMPKN